MEDHVEQQKDHEEHDRSCSSGVLFARNYGFVFAGPLQAIPAGRDGFSAQKLAGLGRTNPVVSGIADLGKRYR